VRSSQSDCHQYSQQPGKSNNFSNSENFHYNSSLRRSVSSNRIP
jgi:hypothetical protein